MFSHSRRLTQEQNGFCVEGESLSLVPLPPGRRDHTRSAIGPLITAVLDAGSLLLVQAPR